jgi:hypothetical protein
MAPSSQRSFADLARPCLAPFLLRGVLRCVIRCMILWGAAAPALGQGLDEYCNFEAPQVKPVAIAELPGSAPRQYLLACNTPDNTIEVFDVTGTLRDHPEPVARIPVGLEPVSVVFERVSIAGEGTRNMLYSVNWLGDSVTFVELSIDPVDLSFQYNVTREVRVTEPREFQDAAGTVRRCDDEPMHLALVDRPGKSGQFLVVVKRTASSYSLLHPFTGAFLPARDNRGIEIADGGRNVLMTAGAFAQSRVNGQVVFGESPEDYAGIEVALRQPQAVAWRPGSDQFWVIGHKGGGSLQEGAFGFDFGLWGIAMPTRGATGRNTYFRVGGLGTVQFNLAFDPEGAFLYVVGTKAQDQLRGNGTLLGHILTRTGFATTMLYRIDMTTGAVVGRDLNLRFQDAVGVGLPVDGPNESLAHATDVVVYRDLDSERTYACMAGFNSARFGMVRVDDENPRAWTVATVNAESVQGVPTMESVPGRAEAGTRGLAVLATGVTANDRAYLLNRLDSSITVIALNGGAPAFVRQLPLQRPEVEPAYVREGRKFLYSTKYSGPGTAGHGLAGFASCASCHVDGRSDDIPWRLTAGNPTNPPVSSVLSPPPDREEDALELRDTAGSLALTGGIPTDRVPTTADANAKGPMTTQSMQGLVNYEVGGSRIVLGGAAVSTGFFADEDDAAPIEDAGTNDDATGNPFDDLISNAPYHWRGDKESLRHFNEAFVNLMGMPQASGAVPGGGLTTGEMRAFERFVNSIHYPPNPLQPAERRYSGEKWTDPFALPGGASEAMLGLKVFHVRGFPDEETAAGRSCVQCHALPEGSTNHVTEELGGPAGLQPLETASLRGLAQKNSMLRLSPVPPAFDGDEELGILTGDFGLGHLGTLTNRKSVNGLVGNFGLGNPLHEEGLIEFLRQLDSGVAPSVGLSLSITDPSDPGQAAELDRLDALEIQASLANCGIAVYARTRETATLVTRGYWYDVTHEPTAYKQVGAESWLSRVALLERLEPRELSDLLLFRGTPLGSERRIASFAQTSSDLPAGPIRVPTQIRIVGTTPNTANEAIVELARNTDPSVDFDWTGTARVPLSLRVLATLQQRLGIHAPGTTGRRHEAPRRLQVTGTDLVHGARLRLTLPNVPTETGPAFRNVELPLHPTTKRLDGLLDGPLIWETDAEFDPRALYTLMLGGPGNREVDHDLRGSSGLLRGAPPLERRIRVQAANLPYVTWSAVELVPFRYEAVP